MDTQAAFGFKDLFHYVVGDMARAVSVRGGEPHDQKFARSEAAVHMIMGFLPRDVIEAMLAGHCVMFHDVMTDSVRDTLEGQMDSMRRATRANIVAMDRAFSNNLTRLEQYQKRVPEGRRDVAETRPAAADLAAEAPVEMPVETPAETLARTGVTGTEPPVRDMPVKILLEPSAPDLPEQTVLLRATPAAIAACRANPEAMAALDACDPERFARAMGIDEPSEAFLAAAASPGSPFDRRGLPQGLEVAPAGEAVRGVERNSSSG